MEESVAGHQIALRVNDFIHFIPAIKADIGAAPVSCWVAANVKELRPLIAAPPQWQHNLWLVTHRDIHRTAKIQAFNTFIKQRLEKEASKMLGQ